MEPFTTTRAFAQAAAQHLANANAPVCYVHPDPSGPSTVALVDPTFLATLVECAVAHDAVEHHEGLINHSHIEAGEDEDE